MQTRSVMNAIRIIEIFLLPVLVLTVLLSVGSERSEAREIIATGVYMMGDGETMSAAEERARMNAVHQAA